jgi:hypothetical protein
MPSAYEKGSALEMAVRAIEQAILAAAPGYNEKRFRIQQTKIFSVHGVRHEVDVWVTVDLAPGYEAIFIFECRNREEKVDKNDIIVFTEKISAAKAQKGFFVAKSFTADAEAQAGLEPKMTLLRVAELPVDRVPVPLGLHGVALVGTNVTFEFIKRGVREEDAPRTAVNGETAQWILDGVHGKLKDYLETWLIQERDRRVNTFPSTAAEVGIHELGIHAEREFEPGQAVLDGMDVQKVRLQGQVRVRVTRPTIVSYFDVATRGRALTMQIEVGGNNVMAVFAFTPGEADPPAR